MEIKQYDALDTQIIATRVFGTEILTRYTENRQKWSKEEFFSHINEKWKSQITKIYDESARFADEIKWGSGSENASFSPVFAGCKRSLFTVYSSGKLQLHLGWIFDEEIKNEYARLLIEHKILTQNTNNSFHVNIRLEEWTTKTDDLIEIIRKIGRLHQEH